MASSSISVMESASSKRKRDEIEKAEIVEEQPPLKKNKIEKDFDCTDESILKEFIPRKASELGIGLVKDVDLEKFKAFVRSISALTTLVAFTEEVFSRKTPDRVFPTSLFTKMLDILCEEIDSDRMQAQIDRNYAGPRKGLILIGTLAFLYAYEDGLEYFYRGRSINPDDNEEPEKARTLLKEIAIQLARQPCDVDFGKLETKYYFRIDEDIFKEAIKSRNSSIVNFYLMNNFDMEHMDALILMIKSKWFEGFRESFEESQWHSYQINEFIDAAEEAGATEIIDYLLQDLREYLLEDTDEEEESNEDSGGEQESNDDAA